MPGLLEKRVRIPDRGFKPMTAYVDTEWQETYGKLRVAFLERLIWDWIGKDPIPYCPQKGDFKPCHSEILECIDGVDESGYDTFGILGVPDELDRDEFAERLKIRLQELEK